MNTNNNNQEIDITGLNKAEVILALWKGSHAQGYSLLGLNVANPTIKDAERWIEENPLMYFDYLNGRVIKCDISGNSFDPRLYDRDCGVNAAAEAINKIRK